MVIKKIKAKKKAKLHNFHSELLEIIGHIISDEDFKKLISIKQHIFFNRYEHLINVSKLSYKLGKIFKADLETCVLAWLLHDYHFTYVKSYIHGIMSAENAKKFWVSTEIQEIIKNHMFPSGRKALQRPKSKEFWIVKFCDSFSAIYEIFYSIFKLSFFGKNKIKMKKNQLLLELI